MSSGEIDLIGRFYAAFARGDGAAMAACYGPGATFSDPVFPGLSGDEPGAMWRMLTGRAPDLTITLLDHSVDGERGNAHWLADYTFTQTGRRVHNDVTARFRIVDGRIAEHEDRFSFWTWSRQALGLPGLLLGWTPLLQAKVQRQARAGLDQFMAGGDGA